MYTHTHENLLVLKSIKVY